MRTESRAGDVNNTVNMPPASVAQGISPHPDTGVGLGFLLGTDYERKKQKLQQELQLDYKHYVSQKNNQKTSEALPQPQSLSLPIDERISVKEKLKEERNKEYNVFLQERAHISKLRRGTPPVTFKPGQVQASDAVNISSQAFPQSNLNTHTNLHPPHKERPASRRDATTLTEAVNNGKSTGTRGPGHRRRRRWQLYRPKEPYSSEEEISTDEEERFDLRYRRRQDRHTQEPEYKEERRLREHKDNRASQDMKEVEAPVIHDQNNNDRIWKSDLQRPDSMRRAARSTPDTSKNKAEFATGLMIGATEEQTAAQMRKEQYRQELLRQIAEQQRNKMKEKRLELRVAASGATDPEKEPDRIKQFGAGNWHHDSLTRGVPHKPGIDLEAVRKDPNPRSKEDKPVENTEQSAPSGKSQVDHSTAVSQLLQKTVPGSMVGAAQGVPAMDYFSDDYHRDFSNMLGEVAIPRVPDVAPPVPPNVPNTYKTPYDAAYYYYGTRNPLDPNLPDNQNGLSQGVQDSGNYESPSQRPSPLRSRGRIEATHQHRASPLATEELHLERSKQRRESVLSYQEALRQQIKEQEERRRREKEEKKQYDAKIEAEILAYNPWGRSGGGAPIKDQQGNVVNDLKLMHWANEESYRNPVYPPGAEARALLSHQLSGFSDQSSPQQLHMQDRYKEGLIQQIEENKRKQAGEREHIRIEEEKEEKRLAMQRARMQQEYDDEQRKLKQKISRRQKNQSWIHEPETHRQEKEKRGRQEKETEKVPQSARGREHYEREPSPPIPTLQKKQTDLVSSRPSSVVSQLSSRTREPSPLIPTLRKKQSDLVASRPSSAVCQLSSRTEHSVSAPHDQPVPARIPQLHGQQEVIRELSALRRYLRKEQKQLEVQLGRTDTQDTHYTPPIRRRPRVDAFESAHKEAARSSARSSSPAAARVNKQNIREFNQLKYRDTASREEVRTMYPDTPTDAQSLDIQQQALLREQQRKIRIMNRHDDHDFLDHRHYYPREKPGRFTHKDSILPSETAFIDVYSGDGCEEQVRQQRSRQRTAPRRRHNCDEVVDSVDQKEHDNQSLQSATSLNLKSEVSTHDQHVIMRQDTPTGGHSSRTEGQFGDEVDVSSLHSALGRRVSVETVATEPWLRPGTSDAVKHSGCRGRPNSRMDATPWLTQRVV